MKAWTAALEPMSMPLVGSSRMMTRGSVASHLPITTFCWLPPDSVPTSWLEAGGAQIEPRGVARASSNSCARSRKPRREVRPSEGSVMFWKIGRPSTTPCRWRSSGT